MAGKDKKAPEVARVDFLVDEEGSRIDLPEDSGLKTAAADEESVGATSPTNWWAYGLIGLVIVVAILFLMQVFLGAPSTDVAPGTPVSEPLVETPQ